MEWRDLPIIDARWICVDVETTGLEVEEGHRVCEVAAAKGGIEGDVEEFTSMVNPERPIEPEASRVSGISDADVANAPLFAQIAPAVREFLEGAVIVAHNAPFDVGFLETELGDANLRLPRAPIIDTTVVAQSVLGLPMRNLPGVARALRLESQPTHRALNDALATRGVLLHGLRRLMQEGAQTVGEAIEALLPPESAASPLLANPLPAIRAALMTGADLQMAYAGGRGTSRRVVRPVRLESKAGRLLLAAYCRERQAPRNFRVDRIESAELIDPLD